MKTTMMMAAVALLALTGPVQAQTLPPLLPGVVQGDWTRPVTAVDNEAQVFIRRAPTAQSALPRLEVRMEFARNMSPAGAPVALSAVALTEFDCTARRSRIVSGTIYSEHNARAAFTSSPGPDRWTDIDMSIRSDVEILEFICPGAGKRG